MRRPKSRARFQCTSPVSARAAHPPSCSCVMARSVSEHIQTFEYGFGEFSSSLFAIGALQTVAAPKSRVVSFRRRVPRSFTPQARRLRRRDAPALHSTACHRHGAADDEDWTACGVAVRRLCSRSLRSRCRRAWRLSFIEDRGVWIAAGTPFAGPDRTLARPVRASRKPSSPSRSEIYRKQFPRFPSWRSGSSPARTLSDVLHAAYKADEKGEDEVPVQGRVTAWSRLL
jgi:hypothetical protein